MASNLKAGLLLYVAILTSCLCAADNSQQNLFSESELENAIASILQDTDDSCHLSGAMEVCQAAQYEHRGRTEFFHLCPRDGDPCSPELCYYSSIPPCCRDSVLPRCSSKSTLFLGEQPVEMTFYEARYEDVHVACFTADPVLEACDCQAECILTGCVNNMCDADEECICKPHYKPPDCCNCTDDNSTHVIYKDPITKKCEPICRKNCRARVPNGPCRLCSGGYLLPDCCKCPPGLEEVNGVCKCRNNTDTTTGECKDGYLATDCCQCDTTGNSTHVFYRNDDDECLPICRQKCSDRAPNGACRVCSGGYLLPDCCNCPPGLEEVNGVCIQEPPCKKRQKIYFLLDATDSNQFRSFCQTMISMEILIAALTKTSEFYAILFPHDPNDTDLTTIFDFTSTCDSIVDGKTGKMSSVIEEFRECNPSSNKYPSMCGTWTIAYPALRKIETLVKMETEGKRQAVIIITDGNMQDADRNITSVTTDLENAGVSTIIAAGLATGYTNTPISVETLRKFTLGVDENAIAMHKKSPTEFVKAIVERLEAAEILCEDGADNVREALDLVSMSGDDMEVYCECVPYTGQCPTARSINIKSYTHPICGGSTGHQLEVGVEYTHRTQSENLEEEIVAAVESILEKYVD